MTLAPGGPTAAGNVLTNDRDVDNGDTKTVIAVNGSQANVGQLLIGIYGTMTLLADGSWNYTLDPSDPDIIALPPDQTAVDSFTYTMSGRPGRHVIDHAGHYRLGWRQPALHQHHQHA